MTRLLRLPMPLRRLAAALSIALAPVPAVAEDVLVFAAASLADVMDDVAELWRAETGGRAVVALAGSAALAQQIRRGAPADAYVSAAPEWMDRLEAEGLLVRGSRVDVAANRLVLVAHGADAPPVDLGPDLDLAALLGDGRLAVGLVDAVPAGTYARAALDSLGLWEAARDRLAQTDDVRAALALVAAGEAPFGVVYATDAAASGAVSVVAVFPEDVHPPIRYPAAALVDGRSPGKAAFAAFLSGREARAAFAARGFAPAD